MKQSLIIIINKYMYSSYILIFMGQFKICFFVRISVGVTVNKKFHIILKVYGKCVRYSLDLVIA